LARAALLQDESQHMRLQRTKLSVRYDWIVFDSLRRPCWLLRDFDHVKLIGRGAFGEVRIVRAKFDSEKRVFAMKIINKDFMIQKNQV
jgi:hypothetical protein